MEPAPIRFRLLGVPVRLEASDRELETLLAIRYATRPSYGASSRAAIRVRLATLGSGFEVQVGKRPPEPFQDAAEALARLDEQLLNDVMREAPMFSYAWAGAVARGELGIVLPGFHRSDKGALVLALLQAGARLLSAEVLAYDGARDRIQPLPRGILLDAKEAARFPDLLPDMHPVADSRLVPISVVGPDVMAQAVPARVVVLATRDPMGRETLQEVSRQEVNLELEQARLLAPARPEAPGSDMLACAPSLQLFGLRWRDPHRAAALLLQTLDR